MGLLQNLRGADIQTKQPQDKNESSARPPGLSQAPAAQPLSAAGSPRRRRSQPFQGVRCTCVPGAPSYGSLPQSAALHKETKDTNRGLDTCYGMVQASRPSHPPPKKMETPRFSPITLPPLTIDKSSQTYKHYIHRAFNYTVNLFSL